MTTARRGNTITLLTNGKVLVAGGWIKYTDTVHASAEIYDPATGSWSATGSMTTARRTNTATLLPNGKVLVAGGVDGKSVILASAEIYDPTTEVWTTTDSMTTGRAEPATILLSTGRVLVIGGWYSINGDSLASAELFRINSTLVPSFIMPLLLSE
jgi:N-acetylneuraminic acid mutarotase